MKRNKIFSIIFLSAAMGLLAGWLLFRRSTERPAKSDAPSVSIATDDYTCSMHPQIRQDGPGDCPICGMALIPVSGTEGMSNEFGFQMTEAAVQLANIQTTVIGEGPGVSEGEALYVNGRMLSDETMTASLVTHVPGRIEKLFVSFTGEHVRAGQRIATIYSPDLVTAQKELIEAQKMSDISPGLLVATKNKFKYWKIDSALVEKVLSSNSVIETFSIYANHSGVVTKRHVSVGDYLSTGEALFEVRNLKRLWAQFEIYEDDLHKVRIGSRVSFRTPALPNEVFRSRITFIDPVINPETRVAVARTEIANAGGALKPEMFITGKVSVASKHTHLTIPKSAVLWTGRRSVTYVKVPEVEVPSFEFREIELGSASTHSYVVVDGLQPGEEVVTNGAFVIDAAAQLSNQASMMNRRVRIKDHSSMGDAPAFHQTVPIEFKHQLSLIANAYLSLKDALVNSDVSGTNQAAKQATLALSNADTSLLQDEASAYWIRQLNAMVVRGKAIEAAEDIETQREQFNFFSQSLIQSIKALGLAEGTLYVQYCPMAFDNTGARWISDSEQIRNPYFGKRMLKCGSVQDSIE